MVPGVFGVVSQLLWFLQQYMYVFFITHLKEREGLWFLGELVERCCEKSGVSGLLGANKGLFGGEKGKLVCLAMGSLGADTRPVGLCLLNREKPDRTSIRWVNQSLCSL